LEGFRIETSPKHEELKEVLILRVLRVFGAVLFR